jgi:hypothetical protein
MLELGAGFHPDFTGRENVFMNGAIHGLSEKEIARRLDAIIEFSELPEFIDMPVRTYSSGMQMRLAFAVTAHVNPDILLLDEVLAVGDEAFQRKCMGRIHDFRRTGGTLVFVSHDPNAVEQICDRAILLDGGRIVMDGRPVDVMERYHRLLAESTGAIGAAAEETPEEPEQVEAVPEEISPLGGWGTGAAVIEEVTLLGPNGVADGFLSGERFSVRLSIRADQDIAVPTIGIGVRTTEGVLCFGTNTRLEALPTDMPRGMWSVTYDVERIPLHEGHFELFAAITSFDESEVFHWLDHAAEFSVFRARPGVGIVAPDAHWTLEAQQIVEGLSTPSGRPA